MLFGCVYFFFVVFKEPMVASLSLFYGSDNAAPTIFLISWVFPIHHPLLFQPRFFKYFILTQWFLPSRSLKNFKLQKVS